MGAGGSKGSYSVASAEGLSPEQVEQLPPEIREKFEKYVEEQTEYIDDLKQKYDRLQVDAEQKYFELEKQFIDTNEKLKTETQSSADWKKQFDTLQQEFSVVADTSRRLQNDQFEKDNKCHELEESACHLGLEKQELCDQVEKKSREIDHLTEEWKRMSEKVNDSNKARLEALNKVDETQSEGVTLQHREARLRQEKEQLKQENEWLNRELKAKTEELLAFHREQSNKHLQLQSQLDEKTAEVTFLEQTSQTLKQNVEEQNQKIESYLQKLKDLRDNQVQTEEQFRNELEAQERLITLYKNMDGEAESKVSELTTAVTELQKLLKQASKAHSDLEAARESDAAKFQEELEGTVRRIAQLEKELEDANELLETIKKKGIVPATEESVAALSPSAAAASRLLKSGMTLTQIYSEYVTVSDSLLVEKDENRRLNDYLDQILQEIEEKAPVLKRQREDYEQSLETVSQLTRQLDAAMRVEDQLRSETDEKARRSRELKKKKVPTATLR